MRVLQKMLEMGAIAGYEDNVVDTWTSTSNREYRTLVIRRLGELELAALTEAQRNKVRG